MIQRTYEEWIDWLRDESEKLDMDEFMRDEITRLMPEGVFVKVFVEAQAMSAVRGEQAPAVITSMQVYDLIALYEYMRSVILAATVVGFKLGQEVQIGT